MRNDNNSLQVILDIIQPGPRYIVIIFSAIHTGTRITLAHFDTRGIGVRALFPRQWRNRARNIVEKTHGVSEFMWTEVSHVIIDLSTYLTRNRAACLESSTSLSFSPPTPFFEFIGTKTDEWTLHYFVHDPAAPRILRNVIVNVHVYANEFFSPPLFFSSFFFFFTSIRDKLETLNRGVYFFFSLIF